MAAAPASQYARSLVCAAKRLRISPSTSTLPPTIAQARHLQTKPLPESIEHELSQIRLPRAVQATYMAPLKRAPTHDTRVCDLQLRSYSVRNLEVFADFAMRAAYFLKLPASGPRPLPRIIERWTVPRSNFVHKKSQENFERITLRRHVQIKDGHPDTVALWLAFLQKHRYYGVGLKANVWDWSGLDVAQDLDREAESISAKLGEKLELFGSASEVVDAMSVEQLEEKLHLQSFKARWGAYGPMGAAETVPKATERISRYVMDEPTASKPRSGRVEEATAADFADAKDAKEKA